MKKSILVCLAVCMMFAFGSIAMAGTLPGTGIQGTLHDLSTTGPIAGTVMATSTETRICVFCHTPHFAAKSTDMVDGTGFSINYYPLWNHDLSTVASYQSYTNGTETPNGLSAQLNADLSLGPGGVSRLCLSCHDGSVALNSYGNFQSNPRPGGAGAITIPAGFDIGTGGDLSNHHPVGFNYADAANQDEELFDSSSAYIGSTFGLAIEDTLWNGNLECVTCHSVHNTRNDGATFLWVNDSDASALCLSCHDK